MKQTWWPGSERYEQDYTIYFCWFVNCGPTCYREPGGAEVILFLLGLKQDNVSLPKTPLGKQHEYHYTTVHVSMLHYLMRGIRDFNFIRSLLYHNKSLHAQLLSAETCTEPSLLISSGDLDLRVTGSIAEHKMCTSLPRPYDVKSSDGSYWAIPTDRSIILLCSVHFPSFIKFLISVFQVNQIFHLPFPVHT